MYPRIVLDIFLSSDAALSCPFCKITGANLLIMTSLLILASSASRMASPSHSPSPQVFHPSEGPGSSSSVEQQSLSPARSQWASAASSHLRRSGTATAISAVLPRLA